MTVDRKLSFAFIASFSPVLSAAARSTCALLRTADSIAPEGEECQCELRKQVSAPITAISLSKRTMKVSLRQLWRRLTQRVASSCCCSGTYTCPCHSCPTKPERRGVCAASSLTSEHFLSRRRAKSANRTSTIFGGERKHESRPILALDTFSVFRSQPPEQCSGACMCMNPSVT